MNLEVRNHLEKLKSAEQGIRKQVYIAGAGISGLIAGYELKKLGHDVTILEGSDRIGGRIFTHRFESERETYYGELGAMRFPLTHHYTLHYIKELNLQKKLIKFMGIFENENCFIDIKNNIFKLKEILDNKVDQYSLTQIIKKVTGLFLPYELIQLIEKTNIHPIELPKTKFSQPQIGNLSFTSLMQDYTKGLGKLHPSLDTIMQNLAMGIDNNFYHLKGGMDQFPLSLASRLSNNIFLEAEIRQIKNLNNKVEIKILHKGKMETINCDYLICTIPFSAVRELSLKNFSKEKMEAIFALNYIKACKILLLCKDKFWEKNYGIQGGMSISDQSIKQIYYPYHPLNVKKNLNQSSGVLLAYTVGEDAHYISSLNHIQRAELSKNHIGRFHKEIQKAEMVLDSVSISWDNHKWAKGGVCGMWPRQIANMLANRTFESKKIKSANLESELNRLFRLYQATVKPEGRIFFAGEHCSTYQAWIQGSILSALKAVYDVISFHSSEEVRGC